MALKKQYFHTKCDGLKNKIPAIIFFTQRAIEYSLPTLCLYIALFFLGQVFYLTDHAYGFFCLFITFFTFDPLLSQERWLESLYYNCSLSFYLFYYLFLKSFFIASFCGICALVLAPWSATHCLLLFIVLLLSLVLAHVLTFFFNQILPIYLLPLLCMSVNTGFAFFFSAGLSQTNPIAEIQVLSGITLVLLPNILGLFSMLLDLKYGPFEIE